MQLYSKILTTSASKFTYMSGSLARVIRAGMTRVETSCSDTTPTITCYTPLSQFTSPLPVTHHYHSSHHHYLLQTTFTVYTTTPQSNFSYLKQFSSGNPDERRCVHYQFPESSEQHVVSACIFAIHQIGQSINIL